MPALRPPSPPPPPSLSTQRRPSSPPSPSPPPAPTPSPSPSVRTAPRRARATRAWARAAKSSGSAERGDRRRLNIARDAKTVDACKEIPEKATHANVARETRVGATVTRMMLAALSHASRRSAACSACRALITCLQSYAQSGRHQEAIRTPSGRHQWPSEVLIICMQSVTISDRMFAFSAANRNQVSISTPLTCRSQSSSHTSSFTARLAANAASVPDEGRNHSPSAARPEVIRGNQRSSGIGSSVVSVRRSRSSVAFAVNVRCSERARERQAYMQWVVRARERLAYMQ